jgi:BirA family transcriptional regulator, biotin operon repressor / biotin---[acetyl-CoA-carboxylase] ligase
VNDSLTPASLAAGLGTHLVGRELLVLPQVGSTNDLLRERAMAGAPEGLVAVADEQTAGRGRRQRRWDAPPGSALLLSVLLRPTWLAPTDSFLLTMLAAVALTEAVRATSGLEARLKWPNDLLLPEPGAGDTWRKAAGVLVDLEIAGQGLAFAVIGCGLNVSWHPDDTEVQYPATSIARAGGSASRLALAQALLRELDAGYALLQYGQRQTLVARWRGLLHTLGRQVRVEVGEQTISGLAEDVSDQGLLLVRDDAGTLHRVLSGDVSLR